MSSDSTSITPSLIQTDTVKIMSSDPNKRIYELLKDSGLDVNLVSEEKAKYDQQWKTVLDRFYGDENCPELWKKPKSHDCSPSPSPSPENTVLYWE